MGFRINVVNQGSCDRAIRLARNLIQETGGRPFRYKEKNFSQKALRDLRDMGFIEVVSTETQQIFAKPTWRQRHYGRGCEEQLVLVDTLSGNYIAKLESAVEGRTYMVKTVEGKLINGQYYVYKATFSNVQTVIEYIKDQLREYYNKL